MNVAIQYYNPPTSTDANYARSVGATPGKAVGLIKGSGYAAMSPTAAAKLVSLDTNVKYISVDRKLQIASTIANDSVMNTTVSANLARGMGYDGTGVGVAVIDSGVNPTADLGVPGSTNSRIVCNANFDPSASTTRDLFGHGTHVASIIAGNATSSLCSNCNLNYYGIAPNANIISYAHWMRMGRQPTAR